MKRENHLRYFAKTFLQWLLISCLSLGNVSGSPEFWRCIINDTLEINIMGLSNSKNSGVPYYLIYRLHL